MEKLLLSLHMMAAAATKTPEMAIDKQEAEILASSIYAVQEHYSFDVSESTTLWVNLITALASVYGPRIFVIHNRKKKERENRLRPVASVSDISNAGKVKAPSESKQEKPTTYSGPIPGMHEPVI